MVQADAEQLNAIILEEQALPQILGHTYVNSILNVEIGIILYKLFFILGNIKITN